MKLFDTESWDRKLTYDVFKDFEDPSFNVTVNIETSNLYSYCKKQQLSFFLCSLHYIMKVSNEITEFRLRIIDGKIWELDKVNSVPIISHEGAMITFIYLEYKDSLAEFIEYGTHKIEEHKKQRDHDPETGGKDLIHVSVLPWFSFTSMKHPHRIVKEADIPKITVGKLIKEQGKIMMPVNIEAHHGLMDGYHIALFLKKLEEYYMQDSFS